jgi:iron complex outermembrane recepter protein
MRLTPPSVLCFLLAPLSLGGAQLQDADRRADTVAVLPPVEISTSILPTRGPDVGSGTGARAQVIDQQRIRDLRPRLLTDALTTQGGFTLYDDLGSAFKPTVVSRGFAASPVVGLPQGISVFVDGVPVNEPDAGQVNFDLLPLRHVREVELLSGTASLLGPYSLGGAVNLVTRRGSEAPRSAMRVTAGSHGAVGGNAELSGSLRGWSGYLGTAVDRETGWRQQTGATLQDVFLAVSRAGDSRGVALQAFAARSRAETAGSLPLSVYRERPDSNLTGGDFELLDQLHLALLGYSATAAGQGSVRMWIRLHDAERFNVNQEVDPDVRSFSANRTVGADADWRLVRGTPGGEVAVRAGLGGTYNDVQIRILAERLDPGLTTDVHSPIGKMDAYVLTDYRAGPVTVSAGLRLDAVRIPFGNRLRPERDTTSFFRQWSPRIGSAVALPGGLGFHASVGRSFRAPAVIELACADPEEPCPLPFALGDDPPLDAVQATTGELGLSFKRGSLSVDATAFRTEVRNDIFLFPYQDDSEPEGSTIDGYFANIDATRREGVEAAIRFGDPRRRWVYARYAFTRATFRVGGLEIFSIREIGGSENEIEVGDRLPLVPAHSASAGGSARLGRFSVVGDVQYVGERFLRGDEANEEPPLPSHVVFNGRLAREFGSLELSLDVRNLTGARYATFGTFNVNHGGGGVLERFLTPGEPRTLRISVRHDWR